jgi:hypothetical protein
MEQLAPMDSPDASLFCTTIQASSSKNVWRPSMQTVPEEQTKVFVSVVYCTDDIRARSTGPGNYPLLDPIGH